jgi:hypothetical protein
MITERLFPAVKVNRPRKRSEHDELREREISAVGHRGGGGECLWTIAWQPEDE